MDIGAKIKEARSSAGETQEAAAEKLGVSRQTLSSWETGKTYPDIVSVVKISDIYNVSLDFLLRDGSDSPGYLDYLSRSTDTVKSKEKLAVTVMMSTFMGIWALAIIVFWTVIPPDGGALFALPFQWILLPVVNFVICAIIGKNGYFSKWQWALPVFFGIMHMLSYYATFKAANMVSNGRLKPLTSADLKILLNGIILSLIALGVGTAVRRLKQRKA